MVVAIPADSHSLPVGPRDSSGLGCLVGVIKVFGVLVVLAVVPTDFVDVEAVEVAVVLGPLVGIGALVAAAVPQGFLAALVAVFAVEVLCAPEDSLGDVDGHGAAESVVAGSLVVVDED